MSNGAVGGALALIVIALILAFIAAAFFAVVAIIHSAGAGV